MSTHIPEHPTDWEAQRERLSALLDRQLSPAESAALRAHVDGCAACAAELEALRHVVGALRAMPQPTAPRSFALPLSTERSDAPRAPLPIATARAQRARWATITQWAGAAAACIGFVLLAGTFMLGGGYGQRTAATFGSEQHAPAGSRIANAPTQPPAMTTPTPAQNDASATRYVGASGPLASPTPTTTAQPTTSTSHLPPQVAEEPDPRAAARTTGVSLLVGGLVALLLGWGLRRRVASR
jgi:hypothetical protein